MHPLGYPLFYQVCLLSALLELVLVADMEKVLAMAMVWVEVIRVDHKLPERDQETDTELEETHMIGREQVDQVLMVYMIKHWMSTIIAEVL